MPALVPGLRAPRRTQKQRRRAEDCVATPCDSACTWPIRSPPLHGPDRPIHV